MDRSLTLNRFTRNFNSLVSKKSRLLVAVSGGMDSIALLHLSSKFKKDYEIFGVHVNHGLREASESEEKFVRGLCHDYNILLSVHNANRDFIPGESMEMWARRIRQDAFESARKEYNCDFVLTAHHANDNAETILMHLDDGCGVEGLRGIPSQNGTTIRPLLKFNRNDIEEYANFHNLNFVMDVSNYDTSIKRNYVRHKVLLPWEDQAKDLIVQLSHLSENANRTVARMNSLIEEISNQIKSNGNQKIIHDKLVKDLNVSQKVRLVKHILGETEISWRRHQWIELKNWLKSSKTGSRLKLNGYWTILRDRDCFIMNTKIQKKINLSIQPEGRFGSDGFNITLNKIEVPFLNSNLYNEVIDAHYVMGKKLVLRSWSKGDRFNPLGMIGQKKVSDLLVDEKVDYYSKEKQLVLTANDEIIWVCGRRLSDTAKVTQFTTEYLELNLTSNVG